jgi:hypothetical protein
MSHFILNEPEARSPGCGMSSLTPTAASHFKLTVIGAVLRLVDYLVHEEALAEFPFLQSYMDEAEFLADISGAPGKLHPQWQSTLARWEEAAPEHLPLRLLMGQAGLDAEAVGLLMTIGLIEEDPRFAAVFEWAQPGCPGQQRPTFGLLTAWWRLQDDCSKVRGLLHRLRQLGLVRVVNPEAPRIQWALETTPLLWDILRGETLAGLSLPWVQFHFGDDLPLVSSLVLPRELLSRVEMLPFLLQAKEARVVVVRGPLHNGRKTLLRAIARSAALAVVEVQSAFKPDKQDDERYAVLGTLAAILRAMPVFTFELDLGETAKLPELPCYSGPVGVVVSRTGTVDTSATGTTVFLDVPLPVPDARREIWRAALRISEPAAPKWAGRFRLTSGGIFRSAGLARAQAALECRSSVEERDVRNANRVLCGPLENQAVRLEPCGGWDHIVAAQDTLAELRTLESRCRYREELPSALAPALAAGVNHGVRALFSGASGTGKTLAARVLAAELQLDIYRLDLSAVVNKYIGETEKNLNQIFSRAEELNVILLLDEGDALLTSRTAVQSSNDRYANLETNFLLQRIESFEGILFITTNAMQRIDTAFQRRMDVVVNFRLPEPDERWRLWRLHLPPSHAVSDVWLQDAACRCNLSGGQIRNAALHATLLALDRGSPVTTAQLEQSIQREYQKLGAVCPLRRNAGGR